VLIPVQERRFRRDRHHFTVADSRQSDPRHIRAARRAAFPVVRARRPNPGRHHPASAADVRQALATFGDEAYYGLESVELVPAPPTGGRLVFGELVGPGQIRLYDQPLPPWRLPYDLSKHEQAELRDAGADLSKVGCVAWPANSLKRFMLAHVLTHELGHHLLQHERRLRGERATRTREHEARAEVVAARLRELLD
jgi:hypothetical protein